MGQVPKDWVIFDTAVIDIKELPALGDDHHITEIAHRYAYGDESCKAITGWIGEKVTVDEFSTIDYQSVIVGKVELADVVINQGKILALEGSSILLQDGLLDNGKIVSMGNIEVCCEHYYSSDCNVTFKGISQNALIPNRAFLFEQSLYDECSFEGNVRMIGKRGGTISV